MAKLELNLEQLIDQLSARDGRKYTQQQIAEMAGIDPGQLSRYIHNRTSSVNFEALGRLYRVFGIDPGPMFKWDEEKESA